MKTMTVFYNARIYTQADGICVDSMAVRKGRIVAVGNKLEHDPDLARYDKIDLKKRTVIPGLVDAHTHFVFFALSLGNVSVQNLDSLGATLKKIKKFSSGLPRSKWIYGEGYQPDLWRQREEPDRYMLDKVTGGHPAFIYSKDQHSVWVNSKALELAGYDRNTRDPDGGKIERYPDGTPTGILREGPAYVPILSHIPDPSRAEMMRLYKRALEFAYERGVTGIHSFDGPDAFELFGHLAEKNKVGLRVNYYPGAKLLPQLEKTSTRYGTGTEFFRLAGIKIFADGSLGSQTGYCFNKYVGSKNNYGIEVTPVPELKRLVKKAAKLGFPCAVHAIGDRAVANVLEAFEAGPKLPFGVRHRIEHLQQVRRKDIPRIKKMAVIGSMQPSHCPADISLVRSYWGKRGSNAYIFRTLIDNGVDLAFGSDAPIEPLDPLRGIAAAVRRAKMGSRDVFHPEQRISAAEALYAYTVGPAVAAGESHRRGYLLPDNPADFVVLDRNITRVAVTKLCDTRVLATVIDGKLKYHHSTMNF